MNRLPERTKRLGARLAAVAAALAIAAAPEAAIALDDGQQLLVGGTSGSGSTNLFTAPGIANTYGNDFPGTGLGESAAQIRMVAGTIGKFRLNVVTQGNATSGTVTVTVRVNGVNTELTCSVGIGGGDCGSGGKTLALLNGDKLAVRVVSTLDQGFFAYTYTLTYD